MKAAIILLVLALLALPIINMQQNDENELCNFTYPELELFLLSDETDKLEMKSDGFMAIELSNCAREQGYNLGTAILGTNHRFDTGDIQIYNYITINDTIYFINNRKDSIIPYDNVFTAGIYRYVTFYPDGTKIPLNVRTKVGYGTELIDVEQ